MTKEIRSVKIPPVLIKGLAQILNDIFAGGFYADKVLERIFKKNRKWGARDRRFLAETTYNMTRWWSLLNFFAQYDEGPRTEEDYLVLWALYEVWKNNRDVTSSLKTAFSLNLDFEKIKNEVRVQPQKPWMKAAFPQWLYERFEKNYPADVDAILKSLNEPAPVSLRTNTLKITRDKLQGLLKEENVQTRLSKNAPDALLLNERQNVFMTKAFKDGLFEVQDEASQKVSLLLNPQPGERIADLCAGAGGKTLHLAALMKNKGTLFAADIFERKLIELKARAKRAGVSNLRVQLIEGAKTLKRQAGGFDGVLIDAPCSGSGVIRRNPDSKWKLSEEEMVSLKALQSEILSAYAKLVKPGGRLVYATCSLLHEENENQIESFLNSNPAFKRGSDPMVTRPDLTGEDGFFAQLLTRK